MHAEKKLSKEQALIKLRRYCAYQERCHKEVQEKLRNWGFFSNERNEIVVKLIEENFLNEERFARAIAAGKFKVKGWGKKKIVQALKTKGISPYLVKESLKDIPDSDYMSRLMQILHKKSGSILSDNIFLKKQKLARHAIQKGYEPELVWQAIDEVLNVTS